MLRIAPLALALLLGGCVIDRTGQSATETYKRELLLQATRVGNLEGQFDKLEARTSQLEELTRARGQDEILKMETLEDLRQETARLRGDLEVFRHEYDQLSVDGLSRDEDHDFRVAWLEKRADLVEKSLGLKTPAPPEREVPASATTSEGDSGGWTGTPDAGGAADAGGTDDPDAAVTDPEAMIKLAEAHLAAGRHKAADAVLARFIELYPKNERVPEAMYRRAEASFNGGDYPAAVLRFQMVIDSYKSSAWAPWAMLRQGECFDAQGQNDNAKLFYEDVVRIWPKSKAAKEARTKLGK